MIARTKSLTRAVGVPVAAAAAAGLFVATPALATQAGPALHHPHVVRGTTLRTRVPGLKVRTAPNMRARSVAVIGRAGSRILVRCWTRGESIRGNNIWFLTTTPRAGFVPGAFLFPGAHGLRGLPRC
jgi:hypothetical protein